MALDRGVLAKIDRQVFAELGHDAATQAVKIPLSDAAWSTWRRYCAAIGLTMGEAVAGLIVHELQAAIGDYTGGDAAVFAERREEEVASREAQVASRERNLAVTEARLSEWTERLGTWERQLQERERRLPVASGQAATPTTAGRKIGRNERCPCGSGRKYKHCHGLPK